MLQHAPDAPTSRVKARGRQLRIFTRTRNFLACRKPTCPAPVVWTRHHFVNSEMKGRYPFSSYEVS